MELERRYWACWPFSLDILGNAEGSLCFTFEWRRELFRTLDEAAKEACRRSDVRALAVVEIEEMREPSEPEREWGIRCKRWERIHRIACRDGIPYRDLDRR